MRFELTAATAPEYLREARGIDPSTVRVTELGGGVSNTVLLVESGHSRFVLKQALDRLRVEQDWRSEPLRALREARALRALAPYLPPASVPEVLFIDEPNLLFAMSAAGPASETWKAQLLRGECHPETAARVAEILGRMMRAGRDGAGLDREFGDLTVFDQLRLDPYYRAAARRHPDLAAFFEELVRVAATRRCTLVHGDWSPKNFLVEGAAVMAIDFEVIHFGDPSFDAAFLTNHLLLKSFREPRWTAAYAALAAQFWRGLRAWVPPPADWFEPAAMAHLPGLLLARIDGKSPAEYITEPGRKDSIRRFARDLILRPPARAEEVFERRERWE
ncbi:MAG: phosphotransferase [Acidobacteria bacterium]|nr:phosphotransferase [Acidobacteriota bacterium]